MKIKAVAVCVAAGLITTACVTVPTGPSVMVLPGNGKHFDQFQFDDVTCRQWASQQTGTTTSEASTNSTVAGAVIGTVLGAAAGAAIGAAAGSPGTGAAVGAGVGLLGGTAVGASNANASYRTARRYDAATSMLSARSHPVAGLAAAIRLPRPHRAAVRRPRHLRSRELIPASSAAPSPRYAAPRRPSPVLPAVRSMGPRYGPPNPRRRGPPPKAVAPAVLLEPVG